MKYFQRIIFVAPLFLLFSLMVPTGCVDNTGIEPIILPPDSVSFSVDLVPLFADGCLGSFCHDQGKVAPDLTAANAYDALWAGGYIDTVIQENSGLYKWLVGEERILMPPPPADPWSPSLTDSLVLKWIQQGALDN